MNQSELNQSEHAAKRRADFSESPDASSLWRWEPAALNHQRLLAQLPGTADPGPEDQELCGGLSAAQQFGDTAAGSLVRDQGGRRDRSVLLAAEGEATAILAQAGGAVLLRAITG